MLLSSKKDHWAAVQYLDTFDVVSGSGVAWHWLCDSLATFLPICGFIPRVLESTFLDSPLKATVIPVACVCTFSCHTFLYHLVFHAALWTVSLFWNDLLWLAFLLDGVDDGHLGHCQVCSLPQDCVCMYRAKLSYTVFYCLSSNVLKSWIKDTRVQSKLKLKRSLTYALRLHENYIFIN